MEIINVADQIIEVNVTNDIVNIQAQTGAYPLPNNVYSVFGRVGNVVATEGDYTLTQLGDVTLTSPASGQVLKYNGTAWVNGADNNSVTSVFGRTGVVTAQSGDYTTTQVTEGTNLYYTDARARGSVSGGTGISYNSSTGVITNTITQYTDSNARAALSFTAGSGAYNSTTGVITIPTNNNQITNGAGYITTADLTGLVPYTGATANVDLGSYDLTTDIVNLNQLKAVGSGGLNIYSNSGTHIALMGGGGGAGTTFYGGIIGTSASFASSGGSDTFAINHSSGSGISLNITKGGNGEGLYINKTSGSGNAATIIGTLNATTLVKNGGTSSQFLKADGSVDATSYQPLITAGTTAQYYRGDKTFQTLDTSVVPENTNLYYTDTRARAAITGTAPISVASGVVSISQAGASTNGYLSSTDWNTFNNKQAAGNYITALTGEVTASGPGSASATLLNSAVTGKVLTGLNVTGGSVSATDSILAAFGKVQNQINGLIGGSIYQSVWNASTNTPTLASGVGTKGYYYIVNVAGSTNLNGITDWKVGDWAIYDGTAWQKVDNTDAVSSVNGFTGAVSLTTDNISEGSTNLYFTNTRAQNAITLTTTGTSGAATYSAGTLNIPQYQAVLTNPVTGTGTTNTLPKFTGTSAIGNSNITDTGSLITLGSNTNISAGSLGIGTSSVSTYSIRASRTLTGGVQAYGITNDGNVQSDVTTTARGFYSLLGTQAATFTLNALIHYHAQQGTFGAGSSVTNQYGFAVNSALIGGTNNYGFYGDIPSGTNRWNLYMNGTANNYLAGSLGIGSTTLTGYSLRVGKSATGATTYSSITSSEQIQSDVTSVYRSFYSLPNTNAATFTLGTLAHFQATQDTFGAGSTVTNQYGYLVSSNLTGATNNYAFRSAIPAGTGRFNLYMDGTADNYLAGNIGIGVSQNYVSSGPILTTTLTNGGSGYVDGTYTDVASTNITAAGNSALYTVIVSGGIVTSATLTWGGMSYKAGDTVTVSNTLLGGAGSGLIITVNTVDSSQLTISNANGGDISLLRVDASLAAGENLGTIKFLSNDTSSKASGLQAEIGAFGQGAFGGAYLSFFTRSGASNTSLVEAMRIGSEGGVGIGATNLVEYSLRISKNITGGTTARGCVSDGTIQSSVTANAVGLGTGLSTAAASFTLLNLYQFYSGQGTIGAGSTVTNQYGYHADATLIGATNNYGFHGNIASGTNRWNLYMAGTAANYMAGNLLLSKTTTGFATVGLLYESAAALEITTNGARALRLNRLTSDGEILTISQASTLVGTIGSSSGGIYIGTGTSGTARLNVKSTGQMRFVPLASDPSGAEAGDIYYNSTTNALKLYDGTVWRTITVI
jgi:hypothetical protein